MTHIFTETGIMRIAIPLGVIISVLCVITIIFVMSRRSIDRNSPPQSTADRADMVESLKKMLDDTEAALDEAVVENSVSGLEIRINGRVVFSQDGYPPEE
jgi:beta-lactamase regulating signal transducer with metallopeptidase domain